MLVIAILTLGLVREAQPILRADTVISPYTTSGQDKLIQAIKAGMLPGLGADLAILRIFSSFYQYSHEREESTRQSLREITYRDFETAQFLDPKFIDMYRLAEGILAYDLRMPLQAVDLLEAGEHHFDQWEIPFMASFIAYDQLHDLKRAVSLAKLAGEKPGVPPLIIGYTSRLMSDNLGLEFAIKYLQERKKALPEGYQHGLEERIRKLKEMQNVTAPKS
ncbi:hypothetical protein ACFL48_03890 [Pseudomonadota bacterium]